MLEELTISGLGVIENAAAEFDAGFTVLTGETGAGKTMVVTSLHLLSGARADGARVRTGADKAVVEGRFRVGEAPADVAELLESTGALLDDDDTVIAARSVTAEGRSRAHLGGRSVPVGTLGGFTNSLLASTVRTTSCDSSVPTTSATPSTASGANRSPRRGPPTTPPGPGGSRLSTCWRSDAPTRASAPRKPTGCGMPSTRSTRSDRIPERTRNSPHSSPASVISRRCGRWPRVAHGAITGEVGPDDTGDPDAPAVLDLLGQVRSSCPRRRSRPCRACCARVEEATVGGGRHR